MGLNCSDYVDAALANLISAGYSFHEGGEGHDDQGLWWFCWSDGKCDVEVGADCNTELEAQLNALNHWFNNAKIPTICSDADEATYPMTWTVEMFRSAAGRAFWYVSRFVSRTELEYVPGISGQPKRFFKERNAIEKMEALNA